MTYRGRVKDGVVLLEGPARPPDGTEVSIRVLKPSRRGKASPKPRTLYDRLKPFIGLTSHLPPDASENVDHYLYGAPKQK